ncbi:MAG: aspartate/glutamate racemase family protein [Anaerolineae bacterium]
MSKRLVLIHTLPALVPSFTSLAQELFPADVEVWHIADEIVLKLVIAQGGLSPFLYRRVAEHVVAAEACGADVAMVTCSSIGPTVDVAQNLVAMPVLKVDEPMADKAVTMGSRIGIAANVTSTLKPTTDLVKARAVAAGKEVVVDPVLCEGAYDALLRGELEIHDELVRGYLKALMARNDVIVLAQASMARVVDTIPAAERTVPILSSPRLGMERARDVLASL